MSSEEPCQKRQKTADNNDMESTPAIKDPSSVLTWNADGLAAKSKNASYMQQFQTLLETTRPQLVCIQEARIKCASRRSVVQDGELKVIQPFLNIVTPNYVPVWSLADKRAAGTCTLIHRDLVMNSETIHMNSAFSVEGAIALLVKNYNLENDEELQEMIQNHASTTKCKQEASPPKPKSSNQTSVKSFFKAAKLESKKKPSKQQASMSTFFTSTTSNTHLHHHEEGRIQFFRFESMDILNTYVPNNGMKAESYERRRQFDADMLHLLQMRQAILNKASVDRPILWVGDLNVARTYMDGTHYSIEQDGTIQEYWKDEKKCQGSDYKSQNAPCRDPDNVGMPGFTNKERLRFELLLEKAKLVDVWRHLHPNGIQREELPYLGRHGGTLEEIPWNKAEYTWRGAVARNQARARYQGKGQRIDYFLLSKNAIERVRSCDILGYGEFRQGYFCGSDHCASLVVFKKTTEKW